ncbi:flavodoxin family protein [Agrococcus sp. Marseille-P2731]|uniref:flavodoxin family protein n=1 Tax=Agrococcus sp. Marseille-P2731 TaxID=1841862 RepID=UPI000930A5AD|nr:NAD(P)H-dependent oxidoreductase [Agrococcus sp. Marseille-P2731]
MTEPIRAIYINCTLTPSPGDSHTELLIEASADILRQQGVEVEVVRAVDHAIAPGVQPDMTEHGASEDAWPALWERVLAADILVLATPIWLGDGSSVYRRVIERLYAHSGELNDAGQSIVYGKVGGVLVGGNEDGMKHVAREGIYALQHIGYTIPPQADAGWVGEAGPGPSYGDEQEDGSRVGFDNDFTKRNITIMAWNLLHLGRMLQAGIPKEGNDRNAWEDGSRFGFHNPEYR